MNLTWRTKTASRLSLVHSVSMVEMGMGQSSGALKMPKSQVFWVCTALCLVQVPKGQAMTSEEAKAGK